MKILKLLFVGAILYACARKAETTIITPQSAVTGSNPPPPPPPPPNFVFEFHQKYNSNALPTNNEAYGNGYIRFQFAGWSIISREATTQNAALQSWIEFRLFDSDNNLVCYILDKRANYHPNYLTSFPSGTDLRSNNHLPDFNKYLPFGNYRLEIKNISPNNVTQNLRLGTQGTGGDVFALLHEDLAQGATKTLNFTLSEQTDGRSYVFNCNVY